jgi:hypothetical protein
MKVKTVHPTITINVTGTTTRRMRIGLKVMRLGVRLVERGGVTVETTRK